MNSFCWHIFCATSIIIFSVSISTAEPFSNSDCPPSPPPLQSKERIINDLEIIQELSYGVKVDYSYNETKLSLYSDLEHENVTISAPGCPKSVDGIPWLHYGNPPRCYFPGYNGPCYHGEVLVVPLPTSKFPHVGVCICELAFEEELLNRSDDGKYGFTNDEPWRVYSFEGKKCYELEEQGPCETGHVLIKSSIGASVKCVPVFQGRCEFNFESQTCQAVLPKPQLPYLSARPRPATTVAPRIRNECRVNEKYSEVLQKCLRREKPRNKASIG